MKKITNFALACIMAVTFMFTFVACGPEGVAPVLNTTAVELSIGKTVQLTLDKGNDNAQWSSSNTAIATVNNGLVLAVGNGKAIITAKVGNKEATCQVTSFVGVVKKDDAYTVMDFAKDGSFIYSMMGITLFAGTYEVTDNNFTISAKKIIGMSGAGALVNMTAKISANGKTLTVSGVPGKDTTTSIDFDLTADNGLDIRNAYSPSMLSDKYKVEFYWLTDDENNSDNSAYYKISLNNVIKEIGFLSCDKAKTLMKFKHWPLGDRTEAIINQTNFQTSANDICFADDKMVIGTESFINLTDPSKAFIILKAGADFPA